MGSVRFFSEKIKFKLAHPRKTASWVKNVIVQEKKTVGDINYIFCSDDYLRSVNIEYLNHHTYTDIVTFDNSEEEGLIEGDIFISIERIKENAQKFNNSFDQELHRVIIHGVLHLIGYGDKKPSEKDIMRSKEDAYLSLRK